MYISKSEPKKAGKIHRMSLNRSVEEKNKWKIPVTSFTMPLNSKDTLSLFVRYMLACLFKIAYYCTKFYPRVIISILNMNGDWIELTIKTQLHCLSKVWLYASHPNCSFHTNQASTNVSITGDDDIKLMADNRLAHAKYRYITKYTSFSNQFERIYSQ